MFGLRKAKARDYRATLKNDALNWQMGFWKKFRDNLAALQLGENERDIAITGAMSNWIFLFGYYGPKVKEQPELEPLVKSALHLLPRSLNEDERVELTAAVIIAAAAQDIPIDKFGSHFNKLHELGIVMRAINIYGLEGRLADEHRQYYYHMQYEVPTNR